MPYFVLGNFFHFKLKIFHVCFLNSESQVLQKNCVKLMKLSHFVK